MARINPTIRGNDRDATRTTIMISAIVAALYFGREIFVPIALAILLSFALAPAVRRLHTLGLGRVFPVLLTTALSFTVIFTLIGIVATQLKDLSLDLPRYEDTMMKKVGALRDVTSGGALSRVEEVLSRLDHAINRTQPPETPQQPASDTARPPRQQPAQADGDGQKPTLVEVRQPPLTPMETIGTYAGPLLHPLATAGIVVIFVVFILLQREDLRNRLIRLFGASDLQRTTEAIDDGAKRLSRYLLTQLGLNATAGCVVGLATWIFGVPNPILWGILFGCLRFVPYIGPIIGGSLPVLVTAAVTTGWGSVIWMAATILMVELLFGQILEPLLYGHNTGLSPVAVVLSATVWTVLWGPIGLLVATPITVCLVVIGRHVEQMSFLDVLLGDQPPLTAPETFYQRMLANDPTEVAEQAVTCLKTMSVTGYYDTVVLPGLLLAQTDVTRERLEVDRQIQIRDATDELISDLGSYDDDPAKRRERWHLFGHEKVHSDHASVTDTVEVPTAWKAPGAILCIGGRSPLDDCGALMLAQVLEKRGLGARAESYERLSKAQIASLDVGTTRLIVLTCLDGSSSAYLSFAIGRIRRRAPRAKILIGAWWLQTATTAEDVETPQEAVDFQEPFVTTVVDGLRFCLAAASALTADDLTVGVEEEAEADA